MKEIMAYETEDGKVFRYASEAQRHEASAKVDAKIKEFFEIYGERSIDHDDRVITLETAMEHKDMLYIILSARGDEDENT